MLADILPGGVRPVELDRVEALDLDGAKALQAFDTQQLARDLRVSGGGFRVSGTRQKPVKSNLLHGNRPRVVGKFHATGDVMGKWIAVVCAAGFLAGYASEPMTDEQRQMAFQYLMAQQNRPQAPAPQPYYMPVPAPAPVAQPRNCISNVNGNTVYTNCN
jgi:hypothetical protein